jgi:hypothetical protein
MSVFNYHYTARDFEKASQDYLVGANWPLPITKDVEDKLWERIEQIKIKLEKGMDVENALWSELRDLLMTGIVMAENQYKERDDEA